MNWTKMKKKTVDKMETTAVRIGTLKIISIIFIELQTLYFEKVNNSKRVADMQQCIIIVFWINSNNFLTLE